MDTNWKTFVIEQVKIYQNINTMKIRYTSIKNVSIYSKKKIQGPIKTKETETINLDTER